MKKLFFASLILFLAACTEEGPTITEPASGSFQFNISRHTINNSATLEATVEKNVVPAQVFNRNGSQIRSIELVDLKATIQNYNNSGSAEERMTLILQTRIDDQLTEIGRLEELVLENKSGIVLFEEGNSKSVLSSAQVGSLEAILDNYEPFSFVLTTQLNKTVDSDFSVVLSLNVNLMVAHD
ncbi:hypothetical protein [Roseivirga thermotolerans]|uniref:Lipid/polyisoprenoid-binding YceI-like domain-containing protein n=1 Tax=Roseivirga thermotolerans TaxID=1758176 RepID=A0ABQ3I9L5_9BACT|nr:hypothetical protein [Roseivirga thermotolerans]GHE66988.1 hypothetical protein GCM10011340_23040 [Roseivirga thermotolerans]